jgi:hypothetical protein
MFPCALSSFIFCLQQGIVQKSQHVIQSTSVS